MSEKSIERTWHVTKQFGPDSFGRDYNERALHYGYKEICKFLPTNSWNAELDEALREFVICLNDNGVILKGF